MNYLLEASTSIMTEEKGQPRMCQNGSQSKQCLDGRKHAVQRCSTVKVSWEKFGRLAGKQLCNSP